MNNMAKLNVVIPAVEVTVDDVTYRKVDRKAQAGDIVKALESDLDIDKGAFYGPITEVSDGYVRFTDNDDFPRRRGADDYEVYAPITEPATATASDTITFEGATWRKVDRDVREGDAIKFTDEDRDIWLTDAELYVVDSVDSCDDPQITDDDGDEYDAGSDDYEVYEKVAETSTQEYREVKRTANVGERIKIVDRLVWETRYANGDTFVVAEDAAGGDVVIRTENFPRVCVVYSEYVVLEPVTKSAESTQPERLAVGDYARVVDGEKINSGARVGDIVEILVDDKSYVPYKVRTISGYRVGAESWAFPSAFVRATDEEVAEVLAAKDPRSKFAAGDKVRLVSGGGTCGVRDYVNGEVYTVSVPMYGRADKIKITGGGHPTAYVTASQLVKLTAAEVAEIERKQAEETKWAAIGRKVNEYKNGDIVECTQISGNLNAGDIGEVDDLESSASFRVNTNECHRVNWTGASRVKLLVPVEQRFDRVEEGGRRVTASFTYYNEGSERYTTETYAKLTAASG